MIPVSYTHLVWKLSRFPSAILLARNKCIEIIDCKTKQIILEIENRFHLYKALFVNEGEIEDILEITYIGKEDRDYYGINGTSIKYFREMKQYNEPVSYTHLDVYKRQAGRS